MDCKLKKNKVLTKKLFIINRFIKKNTYSIKSKL